MKLIASVLVFVLLQSGAIAQSSGGASQCEYYTHGNNAGITGISSEDFELYSFTPGCGIARSPTQALTWSATMSGPSLSGAVIVWTGTTGFMGCTMGTIAQVDTMNAALMSSTTRATLTMTSNECRGFITLTITSTSGVGWASAIPFTIRVESTTMNVVNSGTVTTDLEWPVLLALAIFVLIIIWAEVKREKELYALAVISGAFEVLFLWPDMTPQIRTLLIITTFFLVWRLYTVADEEKNGA